MLFTCLSLLPHADYALNYTCLQVHAISLSTQRYAMNFRLHDDRVLADIGTLEIIVYNLKLIGNFANLNMSFTVYKLLISYCNLNKNPTGARHHIKKMADQ